MSNPAPLGSIADLLERSVGIRQVFGEPVQRGDTTVIPVAQVAYAFGAGGGHGPLRWRKGEAVDDGEAGGSGGGGAVRMTPAGALEIGPDGTRFIRLQPIPPLLVAAALGAVAGWWLARRR